MKQLLFALAVLIFISGCGMIRRQIEFMKSPCEHNIAEDGTITINKYKKHLYCHWQDDTLFFQNGQDTIQFNLSFKDWFAIEEHPSLGNYNFDVLEYTISDNSNKYYPEEIVITYKNYCKIPVVETDITVDNSNVGFFNEYRDPLSDDTDIRYIESSGKTYVVKLSPINESGIQYIIWDSILGITELKTIYYKDPFIRIRKNPYKNNN